MARSRLGPVIGVPFSCISPVLGLMRPRSILRKVLLPQPDGPTMLTNSPLATSRLKSFRAVTASRFFGLKTTEMFLDCMKGGIVDQHLLLRPLGLLQSQLLIHFPLQTKVKNLHCRYRLFELQHFGVGT